MGDRAPKASVIVPFYNQPELLPKCIESILNSTYKDIEIIVVDDCSTDDSWERVAHMPVVGISTLKRIGPAAARNLGSRLARGEILIFFDSDVVVRPDAIERFVALLDANPDLAAAFGAYTIDPLYGNFFTVYKNLVHHFTHHISQKRVHTFWAGCGAVRRDVFARLGGFNEDYVAPCVEDIELGYRLTESGHRVKLDPAIQVTHGKRYSFRTLVKSDFKFRAVPWARLLAVKNIFYTDLNLRVSNVVSGILLGILVPAGIVSAWQIPELRLPLAVALPLAYLLLNARIFSFVLGQKGFLFLIRFIPMYTFTYLYSIAGFALGAVPGIIEWLKRRIKRIAGSDRGGDRSSGQR
ncbi:MAG TPA: glycosyltransferase [Proteobacteria bacterium]|nr:glycosyltransferase [Pseudomonadota bacterium]